MTESETKKPQVYMLCGLTGSGKSTYAEQLVVQRLKKLSLDETMHQKHGRAGVDYPADKYMEYEAAVKQNLEDELIGLLAAGQSVVLDYGFWKQADRIRYKQLIEDNGGAWKLIYLKASPETLQERLSARNKRTDANAVHVTPEMLSDFIERFEEPKSEGEIVIGQ